MSRERAPVGMAPYCGASSYLPGMCKTKSDGMTMPMVASGGAVGGGSWQEEGSASGGGSRQEEGSASAHSKAITGMSIVRAIYLRPW